MEKLHVTCGSTGLHIWMQAQKKKWEKRIKETSISLMDGSNTLLKNTNNCDYILMIYF